MQVFLLRHAEAAQETVALRDPHRHLTAIGRSQARAIGDRLRWHDCTPTHIWSSPLVRAIQTTELVVSRFASLVPVETMPALAPSENPRDVVAALRALPGDAIALLVGHEPGLSGIGALLVGKPDFEGLAKAEAVRIIDGALRWRFTCDGDAPRTAA